MEYTAYDVAKKKKCKILNPKAVKMKNGNWAVTGKSNLSGNTVYRMVGKDKPKV
jgi:hypothetical protein